MSFEELRSVRCTGAEYVAFFSDKAVWPEGRYLTQMVNRINGDWMPDNLRLSEIPADAVIEISDQGDVADDDHTFQITNIMTYFTNWKISVSGKPLTKEAVQIKTLNTPENKGIDSDWWLAWADGVLGTGNSESVAVEDAIARLNAGHDVDYQQQYRVEAHQWAMKEEQD